MELTIAPEILTGMGAPVSPISGSGLATLEFAFTSPLPNVVSAAAADRRRRRREMAAAVDAAAYAPAVESAVAIVHASIDASNRVWPCEACGRGRRGMGALPCVGHGCLDPTTGLYARHAKSMCYECAGIETHEEAEALPDFKCRACRGDERRASRR